MSTVINYFNSKSRNSSNKKYKKNNNSTTIIYIHKRKRAKNSTEPNNIDNSSSDSSNPEKMDKEQLFNNKFLETYNNFSVDKNMFKNEKINFYNKCYLRKKFLIPKKIEKIYEDQMKIDKNIANDIPILSVEKNLFKQNPLLLDGKDLNNYYSYYLPKKNSDNLSYSNKQINFINKEKLCIEKALRLIQKKKHYMSVSNKSSKKLNFLGLDINDIDFNNKKKESLKSKSVQKYKTLKKISEELSPILKNKKHKNLATLNSLYLKYEKNKLKKEIKTLKNSINKTIDIENLNAQKRKSIKIRNLCINNYNDKSLKKILKNQNKVNNSTEKENDKLKLKITNRNNPFLFITDKNKEKKNHLRNKFFSLNGFNYLNSYKKPKKEKTYKTISNLNSMLSNENNQEQFLDKLQNSKLSTIPNENLIDIAKLYMSKFSENNTNLIELFSNKTSSFNINTNIEIYNLINHFQKKSKSINITHKYKKFFQSINELDRKMLKIKNNFIKNRINTYINEAIKSN